MNCVKCPHFLIRQEPIKSYEPGLATCQKHHLVVEYVSRRSLNKLVCVEQEKNREATE